MNRPFVVLPADELREMLSEVIGELTPSAAEERPGQDLVNGTELGRRMGCSRSTVFRLEQEGMPSVRLGDAARRYDPRDCLAWLKAREAQRRAREGDR